MGITVLGSVRAPAAFKKLKMTPTAYLYSYKKKRENLQWSPNKIRKSIKKEARKSVLYEKPCDVNKL